MLTFESLKLFEINQNAALELRSRLKTHLRDIIGCSLYRLACNLLGLIHLVGNINGLICLGPYDLIVHDNWDKRLTCIKYRSVV